MQHMLGAVHVTTSQELSAEKVALQSLPAKPGRAQTEVAP